MNYLLHQEIHHFNLGLGIDHNAPRYLALATRTDRRINTFLHSPFAHTPRGICQSGSYECLALYAVMFC